VFISPWTFSLIIYILSVSDHRTNIDIKNLLVNYFLNTKGS
jgi:hypothetical protein